MDINVGCGSTDLGALAESSSAPTVPTSVSPTTATPTRMLAVDETGAEVDGDQVMAICATAPVFDAGN
jgi:hypothetical protein